MTLVEVDFTLAVLGGCDLRGVDLSGCRLREASLVETDLRKAVLRGADLRGARTNGTRLDEADLRGAPSTRPVDDRLAARRQDRRRQALAFARRTGSTWTVSPTGVRERQCRLSRILHRTKPV